MSDRVSMVKCWFYVRHPSTKHPGTYRYQRISLKNPMGANEGGLLTMHPPAMGDTLFLADEFSGDAGQYRVIARGWSHNQYGSYNWPLGESYPKEPTTLQVLVEPAEGLFQDEEPDDEGPEA
ncbi:hypothetical protein [Nocardia tengchongensis]|uniref:hypothetical protein n=1 Tax=Nocardia tengchongensis TaxID=2055889 RepID=UPI00361EA662